MNKKQVIHSALLLLMAVIQLVFSQKVFSQVTVGSEKDPVSGALLDIKEYDPPRQDKSTATKGLNLPRVALQDIDKLYPMLTNSYPSEEDSLHTGLMVYNTVSGGIAGTGVSGGAIVAPGIYVWNGAKWGGFEDTTKTKNKNMGELYLGYAFIGALKINVAPAKDTLNKQSLIPAGKYRVYFIGLNKLWTVSQTFFPDIRYKNSGQTGYFTISSSTYSSKELYWDSPSNNAFNRPSDIAAATAVHITRLCEFAARYVNNGFNSTLSGYFDVIFTQTHLPATAPASVLDFNFSSSSDGTDYYVTAITPLSN